MANKIAAHNSIRIRGGRGQTGTPDRTLNTLTEVLEENKKRIELLYRQIEKGETFNGQVEQVRELIKAYEDFEAQLEQYQLKLKEVVTGTTFSSIVDSMAAGFRKGFASAEEEAKFFTENFEDMMRDAIIQSLPFKALEKPLAKFYEEFAKFAELDDNGVGLTAEEIKTLRDTNNAIIENASKEFNALKDIAGINFGSGAGSVDDPNQKGLAGQIKSSITEETGSIIAGQFMGLRLDVNGIRRLLETQFTNSTDYMQLGMDKLRQLEQINRNTRLTAEELVIHTRILTSLPPLLTSIDNGVRASEAAIKANGG
ncbi:hypothetical protein ACD591_16345 [Rufibacter glacialis]|uniref:Phage tail tape measure protein n=1 Tax=Rufibacter glacialis TaxID=1259555 RepID=A0A5M8QQE2_9BACT|nr:hypothetical protein [Rufibacter glacialis]KAA6437488.1 hypothetical protein FOE74_03015 [Rufibacter glacialis]